ncbi:MAG: cbb3-type cytochrome c oxidase subunit I, partial [Nitrospira sp.]|nr:cbb3-type cytochrome c oxidase subunit I [Nitrospira sp.]
MSDMLVTVTQEVHHEKKSFWRRYVFSTDHKVIAKQYLALSLFWAVMGGFAAYLIRWQLAYPETAVPGAGWIPEPYMYEGVVPPEFYNVLITIHGTIMVFFVAMPLLLAVFGNYLIPLMIGARDMAFPRLNMLSVWVFALASVVLLISLFVPGGAAAAGWTGYPPLSARAIYTGVNWGMNLWIVAIALEFASFLMGGINFLTTTLNMRAPGMTLFRLPLLVWMQATAAVLFMLSVGPLIAGAVMLLLDRVAGSTFYVAEGGGQPLLWQHLFWFFGHPEVYVILLPAVGIILEILSVFTRKPIFGYRTIVYSTIVAGVLSFIVWAHHQYISGIDPRLAMPFSITTILISVPFAIIVFAMIATLWGGSISFPTPMLFALGTLGVFLIGGLTGIFTGSAPADIYIHDTYFVVAHFHYTLFSAVFFGGFAGLYFWFPKMFGRMMNETLGKIHFALTFIFFNATFFPLFFLGAGGMMRRIANPTQYEFLKPLQPINVFATGAAILLLLGQVPFVINFFWSLFRGKVAEPNPWKANTLEWITLSPPPHENFEKIPAVYRGPYEYSLPKAREDWLPQNQPTLEEV